MHTIFWQIFFVCLLYGIKYLILSRLPNLTEETAVIFFSHFIITLPSSIYHTILNKYRRFTIFDYDKTPLQNKDVVVFVHGRNGYFTDLYPLMDNLKYLVDEKYYLRTVYLGETAYTSIEEDITKLKDELQIYGNCSITLIGMSKGGVIVSSYYVTMKDERIKKAITISSPLMGTMICSAFPHDSKVYQALSYKNSLALSINDRAQDFHLYHVVPKFDHLIIPTQAAQYETTPKANIYYLNSFLYSHSGICYSYDVAIKIANWIA